jgi:hypothetical protein
MPGSYIGGDPAPANGGLGTLTRDTVDSRFALSQNKGEKLTNEIVSAFPALPSLLELAEVQGALSLIDAGVADIIYKEIANPFSMNIPGLPIRPILDQITVNPQLLNMNVTYNPSMQAYSSPLLNAIVAALMVDVQNGGMGIPLSVQQGDQQNNQIRVDYETQKMQDNATAVYESMGWAVPPGAVLALRQEAATQAARNNIESSNKILHESWQLSWETTWKARTVGIEASKALMNFMIETAKLGILEFEARIKEMVAIIQLNLGIAEIQSKYNDNVTKLYATDGTVYDAVVGTLVKAFDGLVGQSKAEADILLGKAKIQFDGAVQMYGYQKTIIGEVARILSQMCASWIGSATAGESITYHEQRSENASESHSWNNNLAGGWIPGWAPQ